MDRQNTGILANFRRGGGRIAYETGLGHGGYAALITLDALPSNHKDIADMLVRVDRISSVRFCETDNWPASLIRHQV
jgi:hypothetical protein